MKKTNLEMQLAFWINPDSCASFDFGFNLHWRGLLSLGIETFRLRNLTRRGLLQSAVRINPDSFTGFDFHKREFLSSKLSS